MSFWRSALVYLGFADDDLEHEIASFDAASTDGTRTAPGGSEPPSAARAEPPSAPPWRAAGDDPAPHAVSVGRGPAPRPADRVFVIEPEVFEDAREVGDVVRAGGPVVVNLRRAERDLAKRMTAFSCGLAYALRGDVRRLAPELYLVTPEGLEVSVEDRRRLIRAVLERSAQSGRPSEDEVLDFEPAGPLRRTGS